MVFREAWRVLTRERLTDSCINISKKVYRMSVEVGWHQEVVRNVSRIMMAGNQTLHILYS